MKRRLLLLLVAAVFTAGLPLAAQGAELSTYFERAASAEYEGDQVLTCKTPVGIRDTAAVVQQKDGVIYVRAGVDGAPTISAGAGTLAAQGPGGSASSIQFAAATKAPSGYTMSGEEQVTYLGRLADRVSLSIGGKNRVRLTFDRETGALLRSETLNADGSVYCTSKLTSFTAGTPNVVSGAAATGRKVVKDFDFSTTVFPAKLGAFRRLDVYGWNDVGEMAYYSDGFFAFALYHVEARFSVESISDAREWKGKSGTYWRWFLPGTTTLVWDTSEGGMALHGDLPVDLQTVVLAGLPAPSSPNLLSRILELFGG
ncbi:MAG: hypothetical protein ACR2NT_14840 [Acidimicrobiia bacterium]